MNEEIYHISKKGLALINFEFPDLAEEIHRTTEPKLKSVKHSLIIAESLLHYLDKYEIVSLSSESRLRSDKVSERWKQYKRLLNFEKTHALGDYKVCLFNPNTKEIFVREAEATVRYSIKSMMNKPKQMDWFALDKRESERVKLIAQVTCETLAITKTEQINAPNNNVKNSDDLLHKIGMYGGVVNRLTLGLTHKSLNSIFHSRIDFLIYSDKIAKFTGSNMGKNYGTLYCLKEKQEQIEPKIYQLKWIYELLFLILSKQYKVPNNFIIENLQHFILNRKVTLELQVESYPVLQIHQQGACVLSLYADLIIGEDGFGFTGFSQLKMEKLLKENSAKEVKLFAIGNLLRYNEMKTNEKIRGNIVSL